MIAKDKISIEVQRIFERNKLENIFEVNGTDVVIK